MPFSAFFTCQTQEELFQRFERDERISIHHHYEGETRKHGFEIDEVYLQGLRDSIKFLAFLGAFNMEESMKTILQELFDGSIYPDELIISRDPEYWPLNQKISGMMDMWRNKLSKDDFTALEALLDLRSQVDSMHPEASFMYGLSLPHGL